MAACAQTPTPGATTAPAAPAQSTQAPAPAAAAPAQPTQAPAAAAKPTTAPAAKPTTAPAAKAASGQAVQIRWTCYNLGEAREKVGNDLAAAFTKENPSINVKMEWRPSQQYWEKIQTEFAAGTAPEITVNQMNWLVPGAARGMFVDLTPSVTRDKINKDDYFPESFQSWTWKGKLWAGIMYGGGETYYLNKELFEKAGVKLPPKDWSFDDLLTSAKALTKGEGPNRQFGFNLGYRDIYMGHGTVIVNWGGKVLNEKYDKAIWAEDPKSIEATQWLMDLVHKHKVSPTPQALQGQPDPFKTKKVAMAQTGSFAIAGHFADHGENLVLLGPPKGPAGSFPAMGSNAWSIVASTKLKEESWQLVKYLMTKPGQDAWSVAGVPGLKESAYGAFMKNYPTLDLKGILDRYAQAGRDYFPTPDSDAWWRAASQELAPMWSGEKDVPTAMKSAQQAVNDVFAKRPEEWRS